MFKFQIDNHMYSFEGLNDFAGTQTENLNKYLTQLVRENNNDETKD